MNHRNDHSRSAPDLTDQIAELERLLAERRDIVDRRPAADSWRGLGRKVAARRPGV